MERTVKVLNQMKSERVILNYALGGAVAALFYMEPIETHDLDVFISLPPRQTKLLLNLEYISTKGYVPKEDHVLVEGVPVQFLVASTPLVEEAMSEATELNYGSQKVAVMKPEHLVAIMVEMNRPKDRVRLGLFLDQVSVDLQRLRAILKAQSLQKKWKRILREIGYEVG